MFIDFKHLFLFYQAVTLKDRKILLFRKKPKILYKYMLILRKMFFYFVS